MSIDSKSLLTKLRPTIEKFASHYSFTGLTKNEITIIAKDLIESSHFDYETKIDTFPRLLMDKLNTYVKDHLEDDNNKMLSKYFLSTLPSKLNYNAVIASFERIQTFFETIDYTMDPDVLMQVIRTTPKVEKALSIVYKKDKVPISNGDSDLYCESGKTLVEAYCIFIGAAVDEEEGLYDDINPEEFTDTMITDEEADSYYEDDEEEYDSEGNKQKKQKASSTEYNGTEDVVRVILRTAGQFPILDPEVQKDLVRKYQAGNMGAKDKLVNHNLRLVINVAKKFRGRGVPFEDLIQEGCCGLMNAIDKFDPTKKNKFSTYAVWWIRQAVDRSIGDKGRTIRVPIHALSQLNKINGYKRRFVVEQGREPTESEIAGYMGMTPAKVRDLLMSTNDALSLNAKVDDDEDTEMEHFVAASTPSPEEELGFGVSEEDMIKLLHRAGLDERAINVLVMRFGIGGNDEMTLEEVGQLMGVTRERIRQIEEKALKKLVRYKGMEGFADYMDDPDTARETLRVARSHSWNKGYKHGADASRIYDEIRNQKTSYQEPAIPIEKAKHPPAKKSPDAKSSPVMIVQQARHKPIEGVFPTTQDNQLAPLVVEVNKKGEVKTMSKTKVYDMLGITKEQYETVLLPVLTEEEKRVITLKFGDDIENPVESPEYQSQKGVFWSIVLPDLRTKVNNLNLKLGTTNFPETKAVAARKTPNAETLPIPSATDAKTPTKKRNGKQAQPLYVMLGITKEQYETKLVETLTDEEKYLIDLKYGDDLDNPEAREGFTTQLSTKFSTAIIPKLRRRCYNMGLTTEKPKSPTKKVKTAATPSETGVQPSQEQVLSEKALEVIAPKDSSTRPPVDPEIIVESTIINPEGKTTPPATTKSSSHLEDTSFANQQASYYITEVGEQLLIPGYQIPLDSTTDEEFDAYITSLTEACQALELRIAVRKRRLDEAAVLYKRYLGLVAELKEIEAQTAENMATNAITQGKEKTYGTKN